MGLFLWPLPNSSGLDPGDLGKRSVETKMTQWVLFFRSLLISSQGHMNLIRMRLVETKGAHM